MLGYGDGMTYKGLYSTTLIDAHAKGRSKADQLFKRRPVWSTGRGGDAGRSNEADRFQAPQGKASTKNRAPLAGTR
jgi:hypothetical protein